MSDFRDQPWFHSMEHEAGRFVVYVKYMDKEVFAGVPDTIDDEQVVVHFSGAKLAKREMFTNNPNAPGATLKAYVPSPVTTDEVDELTSTDEDKSLSYLISELDKIEKHCGSRTLQDIFYEIHDGKNAVTDFSSRNPETRKSLERLYNEYGFDLIYDSIDG